MPIDRNAALEKVLSEGDEWQSWRALRLSSEEPEVPHIPQQEEEGGFFGETGRPSAGETGLALCHLVVIGQRDSAAATIAADWLLETRTPAEAWLDSPDDVPGEIDTAAAGRVWATASATAGLLAVGRDPGHRAIDLLRGEADLEGRFTGGAYPTFAASAAYWLAEGRRTEMAEWGLRWAREWAEEWWGAWEFATALTFWGAAGVPLEHASVDSFMDQLMDGAGPEGWPDDNELTLRTIELAAHFGA
ncbi:MAG: hypothetical protein QOK47_385 [Actinomycetota bacterium]|nr:hypothetical protein [Actinomycetota bacterium]